MCTLLHCFARLSLISISHKQVLLCTMAGSKRVAADAAEEIVVDDAEALAAKKAAKKAKKAAAAAAAAEAEVEAPAEEDMEAAALAAKKAAKKAKKAAAAAEACLLLTDPSYSNRSGLQNLFFAPRLLRAFLGCRFPRRFRAIE